MKKTGLLTLSHSSRNTVLRFCDREVFRKRYGSPTRLDNLPPFESLPGPRSHFSGAMSFYRVVVAENGELAVQEWGSVKAPEKIQSAVVVAKDQLLMAFDCHMELWQFSQDIVQLPRFDDVCYQVKARFTHPHIAGIRTVEKVNQDTVLLSCAAADSVYFYNWKTAEVTLAYRLPEALYGANYVLDDTMDLHQHYIGNDAQTTHINAAAYHHQQQKIAVTTLIQGAVGEFCIETGDYREITRDYIGCHGARYSADLTLYFSDSCSGNLIFLDPQGKPDYRFGLDSKWLHDSVQIIDDIYAFALSDKNRLEFHNIKTQQCLYRKKFLTSPMILLNPIYRRLRGWLGNSNQFLSFQWL